MQIEDEYDADGFEQDDSSAAESEPPLVMAPVPIHASHNNVSSNALLSASEPEKLAEGTSGDESLDDDSDHENAPALPLSTAVGGASAVSSTVEPTAPVATEAAATAASTSHPPSGDSAVSAAEANTLKAPVDKKPSTAVPTTCPRGRIIIKRFTFSKDAAALADPSIKRFFVRFFFAFRAYLFVALKANFLDDSYNVLNITDEPLETPFSVPKPVGDRPAVFDFATEFVFDGSVPPRKPGRAFWV